MKKTPVSITNCQIKAIKFSTKMDVVMRAYTKFEASRTKFDQSKISLIGSTVVNLQDLTGLDEYTRVTVRAQVIKINEPEKVGKGLTKQDVNIADATKAAILTLCGPNINKVKPTESYEFQRLIVRKYRGKYQLSFPRNGAGRPY